MSTNFWKTRSLLVIFSLFLLASAGLQTTHAAPAKTHYAVQDNNVSSSAQSSGDPVQPLIQTLTYLFDVSLTEADQAQYRQLLTEQIQSGDNTKIQQIMNNIRFSQEFWQKKSVKERAQYRKTYLPVILLDVQKNARAGNTLDKFILEMHTRDHLVLAQGTPPMTQPIADLALDVNRFLQYDLKGKSAPALDTAERDKARQEIAADYGKMSSEQQRKLADTLARIGAFRNQWRSLPKAQRAQVVQVMQSGGNTGDAAIRQQKMLGLQSIYQRGIAQSWNFFMGQMHTLYGGPRWNPSMGRWEHDPGMRTTLP